MDARKPWGDFVPYNVYDRGQEYYFSDAVVDCDVTKNYGGPDGYLLSGMIRGNSDYEVNVALVGARLWREGLRCIFLTSHCDCPGLNPCKHAAACMHYFENMLLDGADVGDFDDDDSENEEGPAELVAPLPDCFSEIVQGDSVDGRGAVDTWLQDFTQVRGGVGIGGAEVIRWTFSLAAGRAYAKIGAFRSKPLKSGGWSRGKRLRNMYTFREDPPACADADDVLVASLLVSLAERGTYTTHGGSEDTWICVHNGANELMHLLLKTRRLTLRQPSGPMLQLGDARTLVLHWGGGKNKRQLFAQVDDAVLVPFSSPWYFDASRNLLGPVESSMPEGLLRGIEKMPIINDVDVACVMAQFRQQGAEIDPPEGWQSVEIEKPQAIAFFAMGKLSFGNCSWGSWRNTWECPCEFLVPAVRYGKHVFAVYSNENETQVGDQLIRRNIAYEQSMVTLLRRSHLMNDDETYAELTPRLPFPEYSAYITEHRYLKEREPRDPELVDGVWPLPQDMAVQLMAAGWEIQGIEAPEELIVGAEAIDAVFEKDGDWFQLDLGVQIGDERVDLIPALADLIREGAWEKDGSADITGDDNILIPLPKGRLLRAPRAPLQRIAHHLFELLERGRGDTIRLNVHDAELLDDLEDAGVRMQSQQALIKSAEQLRELARGDLPKVQIPKTFIGELRPYQAEGVAWMHALRGVNLGGLLADDMGLGKTVMTIAFCAFEKSKKRLKNGVLIIAPRSMLGVWQKEFKTFAPKIKVLSYHGTGRDIADMSGCDVMCTTYAIATRDVEKLKDCSFDMIVCDEAQILKNPRTKATRAINTLSCGWRLALTGTPMENHLGELWSLMRWLNAGLLGTEKHFSNVFRKPIEKDADPFVAERLRRRIAPVMLRRSKDIVAKELPKKTTTVISVEMGKHQRELYESIRVSMDDRLQNAIASKGLAKSSLLLLEALLRLRQVCCDPSLIDTEAARCVDESAKLERLMEMLPTLVEDGRRILIFSQFTGMLDRIGDKCNDYELPFKMLTGKTTKRQPLIDSFQNGEFPIFLISLKAGGTGLTLTEADTVIHFDPWWNPAAEDQATDRAHRIGQDKPVFVYRFIVAGSVEERISGLQERKRDLAASLYGNDGQISARLNEKDVEELFRPLG